MHIGNTKKMEIYQVFFILLFQHTDFSQIIDIEGLVESSGADMLYLKSKLTGTEIDIYEYDLVDYKIKNSESTIYVKLRNKEVPLMY